MQQKRIPLLVNGSIDTKTNPKLVRPGSLLELENMYQLRTGEMRPRNGFARITMSTGITQGENLFTTKGGGLATVTTGFGSIATPRYARASTATLTGNIWSPDVSGEGGAPPPVPFPAVTAGVKNLEPNLSITATSTDCIDPDLCFSGGYYLSVWTDGVGTDIYNDFRELTTGATKFGLFPVTLVSDAGRPAKVAGNGTWTVNIRASGGTISARGYNLGVSTSNINLGADISAASPWFDVKQIPGTNNFAVAYNVTGGGGVKCGIFNPSAGTFTSVVTTAAADPSFSLGWLDDALATGNMYLVTAGSTAGVVVRTMSATTMVVSATNVIDATATTGIRNVTGHIRTGATAYVVFWDVSGSSTIYDQIKIGRWNGSASVAILAGNHSLYSRSFKLSDGTYYLMACFSSPVQATYSVFATEPIAATATLSNLRAPPVCTFLSGESAGRRLQCSVASPQTSGSSVVIPVSRSRKITTPTGTAPQAKIISLVTLDRMTKVTRARELGGSVFIPGGILQVDDGVGLQDACFPFYSEAPTGTPAVGGSMTASGSYLYRIVLAALDGTSRALRAAGSIQLAVTLGGGDGTVNLAIPRPKWLRSIKSSNTTSLMFGGMFAEVYRRGPAASGATLYNKVGQVNIGDGGTDTIAFADTMSDATAALGEVAYFNGNTLENFNPPAHTLLEVNGNRVGIVNAEDTTEFWFSKEYKAGAGLGFNPLLKVAISGDGAGGMTALAAMDGRWILFKRSAIYVLSGDGPNDLGQGSFNQPQAVSRTIGTINPSSVIETPDGIMFQAQSGDFWLINRGLSLEYIGKEVEAYTHGVPTDIVGAALVSGLTTVRFVSGREDGLMLEWDYFHKRWYRHLPAVNGVRIVDCANSSLFGWCYLLDNGTLMSEGALAADDIGGLIAIVPKVSFPHIQLAGLSGYQRLHAIEFTLDVNANHTLSVSAEFDFSGALIGGKTIALTTATPTIQVSYNPPEGFSKCTSVRPVITATGIPTSGTFRLTGAVAVVSVKRGTVISATERLT